MFMTWANLRAELSEKEGWCPNKFCLRDDIELGMQCVMLVQIILKMHNEFR